jgi:hypothetical protein
VSLSPLRSYSDEITVLAEGLASVRRGERIKIRVAPAG